MQSKTLGVLEFNKIRDFLAEGAVCAQAKERAAALEPSGDIIKIKNGLAETTEAQRMLYKKGAPSISPIGDIRASVNRAKNGGVLSMRDLLNVGHVLRMARELAGYFDVENFETDFPMMNYMAGAIEPISSLEIAINSAILGEEEMADDASDELFTIRRKMRSLNNKIRDVLNDMIKSQRYADVLQDAIVTQRDGRFVIPVKSDRKSEVSGVVHDSSSSGQTLFVEPMAIVDINNQLHALAAEEKDEIERILANFSINVGNNASIITLDYNALIDIDFAFAKGKLSRRWNMSEPIVNTDGITDIKKARHPLIDPHSVVPIDIFIGEDFDTLVITGPNTGGKTVSLKTLGLLEIMAQSGLHIPAAENSRVAVFDDIFADIGDEQSIEQSLSTFSAHMKNIIEILKNATENSLVLFDELGAGTDPIEGAALAVSILETVRMLGAKCAATTHYSEIKLFALTTDGVENAACEFDVATLKPTYRLLIGVPGKSNAFAISKRLGLDEDIIARAQSLVGSDNRRFEDVISSLEESRKQAEEELKSAEEKRLATEKELDRGAKERARIEKERERIIREAKREAKEIYDKAKTEADSIIKEMRESAKKSAAEAEKNRQKLRENADELDGDLRVDVFTASSPITNAGDIYMGMNVLVTTMGQEGIVTSLPDKNNKVTVEIGGMSVKTAISTLEKVAAPKKAKVQPRRTAMIESKTERATTEIDLRGQTLDEAVINVEKFIDDAMLANIGTISIIHGKGTGVLRSGIHALLKKHKGVKSFRLGVYGEGENGVTIVTLK